MAICMTQGAGVRLLHWKGISLHASTQLHALVSVSGMDEYYLKYTNVISLFHVLNCKVATWSFLLFLPILPTLPAPLYIEVRAKWKN